MLVWIHQCIIMVILYLRNSNKTKEYYYYTKTLVGWLIVFYGISTLVSYLMLNPIYTYISNILLYFGLRPGQKCHSKVMHRKEVTHSNGSYERKSRGRKLADEIGRGKKIPMVTHRLMHRKRVTCELHDSYFCLMTIQHAIPKIE